MRLIQRVSGKTPKKIKRKPIHERVNNNQNTNEQIEKGTTKSDNNKAEGPKKLNQVKSNVDP